MSQRNQEQCTEGPTEIRRVKTIVTGNGVGMLRLKSRWIEGPGYSDGSEEKDIARLEGWKNLSEG